MIEKENYMQLKPGGYNGAGQGNQIDPNTQALVANQISLKQTLANPFKQTQPVLAITSQQNNFKAETMPKTAPNQMMQSKLSKFSNLKPVDSNCINKDLQNVYNQAPPGLAVHLASSTEDRHSLSATQGNVHSTLGNTNTLERPIVGICSEESVSNRMVSLNQQQQNYVEVQSSHFNNDQSNVLHLQSSQFTNQQRDMSPQIRNNPDLTVYSGLNSSIAQVRMHQQPVIISNANSIQHQASLVSPQPKIVQQQENFQKEQMNNDQMKVHKTLKPVRPHGNGAVPSKNHIMDSGRTDEDEACTDFYVWGADKHGQLGQNVSKKIFTVPRQCLFKGAEKVLKVCCGDTHSAIITLNGLLYTFGSTQGGKLGLRDKNLGGEVRIPTLVEELALSSDQRTHHVIDVCCANSFTLAVTSTGQVFSWGTNLYGALGLGDQFTQIQRPTIINTLVQYQAQIVKASARYNHSVLLDSRGQVYMCGRGDKGQLGLGQDFLKNTSSDQNLYYPTLIQSIKEAITDVQAGRDFSMLLTANMEVLACGVNNQGQLGLGDTTEMYSTPSKIPNLKNVRKLQCNEGTIALQQSGDLYMWGPISKDKSLIIPTKVQSLSEKIVDCSIGKFTYSAIDEKQMVWVWGDNKQAQLGLSDYTARQTPYPLLSLNDKQIDQIAIGQNFCIAISRKPKLTVAESLNLVTLNGNSDKLNVVNSDGSLLNHMQGKPSVGNLQQTPIFNHQSNNQIQAMSQNNLEPCNPTGSFNSIIQSFQSPNFVRHQSQNIECPNTNFIPIHSSGGSINQQTFNIQPTQMEPAEPINLNQSRNLNNEFNILNRETKAQTQLTDQQHNLTSYMTPSNYLLPSQDVSSGYHTNTSQMYTHPVLPSMPVIGASQNDGSRRHFPSDTVREETNEDFTGTLISKGVDMARSHRPLSSSNTGTMRSNTNHLHQDTASNLGSQKSCTDQQLRTWRTKHINIQDYENQLEQMDRIAEQYEQEMNDLRASNQEQAQDLHTMIKTVNEVKAQQESTDAKLQEKEREIVDMREEHSKAIKQLNEKHASQLAQQIEQIDYLTQKMEEVENQFKGPKNQYVLELEDKSKEVAQLKAQLLQKQRDLIQMTSDQERFKIQIESLNQKISDLEIEASEFKKLKEAGTVDQEKQELIQSLDLQKNMNKCQAMTIEKLENRILVLEANKNEDLKADQTNHLEKAQLQRKVVSLENQLRFQTNLNEETKKEIEKLDGEISHVAHNCSNREQILQGKLETATDQVRQERVQVQALKNDIIQKENYIDKLKTQIRQLQSDVKLAQLENETLVRQQEHERQGFSQVLKDNQIAQVKNNTLIQSYLTAQNNTTNNDSYVDMSYSHSPSMTMKRMKNASSSEGRNPARQSRTTPHNNFGGVHAGTPGFDQQNQYDSAKQGAAYNQSLLSALERRTMAPLCNNYQEEVTRKTLRNTSIEDRLHSHTEGTPKPKQQNEEQNVDSHGNVLPHEYSLKDQRRKYNVQVGNQVDKLLANGPGLGPEIVYGQSQGPGKNRAKSADPNSSLKQNVGVEETQKQPTYIQKILKLNRTDSASSSQKYPFAQPSWQQLLKNKHQAIGATAQQNVNLANLSAKYDQAEYGQNKGFNSFKRRSSQKSQGSNGSNARNTIAALQNNISMRDIGDDSINQRDTEHLSKDTSGHLLTSNLGIIESQGTLETKQSVRFQQNITQL